MGFLVGLIIKKYRPLIIAITGSVGKTNTKLAIKTLFDKKKVVCNKKQMNDEMGVYATLVGMSRNGGILWRVKMFFVMIAKIVFRDKSYPDVFVLDVASSYPGQLDYISRSIRPRVGVLTSIGPTQLEYFGTLEKEAKEKKTLLTELGRDSIMIVNSDSSLTRDLIRDSKSIHTFSFGVGRDAIVQARNIAIDKKTGSTVFQLFYDGASVPVVLGNNIGKPVVYASLAASAVGISQGMNLIEISDKLATMKSIPGRLNILPGIKNTKIIDDTYDASPVSVRAGIEVLSHLECEGEKYFVFGDMLNLGRETHSSHREVGRDIVNEGIDYLYALGSRSLDAVKAAEELGMDKDQVYHFDKQEYLISFLKDRIEEGDMVFVKGSARMRMERVVESLLADPSSADEVLVKRDSAGNASE